VIGGKVRRYYRATDLGQETLREAQTKIKELVAEVLGEVASEDPQQYD
jgi:DNA-binding PadR family transcriptional regulator